MNDSWRRLLAGLDDEGRAVAEAGCGPVVVLAGAGTGKTTALTRRIAAAVANSEVPAGEIMAVTFTNQAAGELRTRLTGLGVSGVAPRTFHAAALAQLAHFWQREFGRQAPQLLDDPQQLLSQAVARTSLSLDERQLVSVASEISWAKASLIAPDDYARLPNRLADVSSEQVAQAMEAYETAKAERVRIDLDDIMLCLIGLLESQPRCAAEVRRHYSYFAVDEFQDVSAAQYRLLELWLGGRDAFCVVGDPAQSIHGYAGADDSYLRALADRPDTKVIRLHRNYRSSPEILAIANQLTDAPLTATHDSGPTVQTCVADSDEAEIASAVDWLVAAKEAEGCDWGDCAVAVRVNSQTAPVLREFADRGIPARRVDESTSSGEAVAVLTLHAAKGREWDVVALLGWHEGGLPYFQSRTDAEIASERRLAHVGVTRAKRCLWLSWAGDSSAKRPRVASRFWPDRGVQPRPARPRKKPKPRTSWQSEKCSVCAKPLMKPSERKPGLHDECFPTELAPRFESLREWRAGRARSEGVPAFLIFSDATLRAMVLREPKDADELAKVPGVGAVKLEQYGTDVLRVLTGE